MLLYRLANPNVELSPGLPATRVCLSGAVWTCRKGMMIAGTRLNICARHITSTTCEIFPIIESFESRLQTTQSAHGRCGQAPLRTFVTARHPHIRMFPGARAVYEQHRASASLCCVFESSQLRGPVIDSCVVVNTCYCSGTITTSPSGLRTAPGRSPRTYEPGPASAGGLGCPGGIEMI